MIKLEKNTIKYKSSNSIEELFLIKMNPGEGFVENIGKELILSVEDQLKYDTEVKLLKSILSEEAINDLLINVVTNKISIKEQLQLIKKVSENIKEKGIDIEFLDYLVPTHSYETTYDHPDIIVGMKPNQWFPIISAAKIKQNCDSILGKDNYDNQKHERLITSLREEENKFKLLNCKDEEFVKESLKPFKALIKKSQSNNKNLLNEIKNNEEVLDKYLKEQKLDSVFQNLTFVKKKTNTFKMR